MKSYTILTVGYQMRRPSNGRLPLLKVSEIKFMRESTGNSLRATLESNFVESTRHDYVDGPLGARPYIRVIERFTPDSSMNFNRFGSILKIV